MSETRLPPRPDDRRGAWTAKGAMRERYNAEVEGRPTRFIRIDRYPLSSKFGANPAYESWAARADAWAKGQERNEDV